MVGFTLRGVSTPAERVEQVAGQFDATAEAYAAAIDDLPAPQDRVDAYTDAVERAHKARARFTAGRLGSVYDIHDAEQLTLTQLADRLDVTPQRAHQMKREGQAIREGQGER